MATAYPLPKWGLTMEEGIIVRWTVPVGEAIREGQVVGLVATDKIEMEFESPVSGVIAEFLAQEGVTVPVGQNIVVIAADQQDFEVYVTSKQGQGG